MGSSFSSDILTCRCRHCGNTFQYVRSDAGANAECPMCRGSVVLPGHLQGVATKRKARVNTRIGLAMEIGGFLLFIWWPIGTIAGAALIFFGWRKNMALRCSNCEEPTTAAATKCSKCHAAFSSD
jgi:Zn finger protein HypA/HybF involved in hydrogenase expression